MGSSALEHEGGRGKEDGDGKEKETPSTSSNIIPIQSHSHSRSFKPNLRNRQVKTPIELLADKVKRYLHLPDPGVLYTVMGAVAANIIPGGNCWLMLVGPPSVGKTELLFSLMGMVGVYGLDDISGPAALLSGTSKKEKAKDATGGLLRQIGNHGCILIDDFTGVLSMGVDEQRKIMAAFRGMYKGQWTREIGTDGGRSLTWGPGRVALLAGCTDEIDRAHSASQAMGERWVYYRLEPNELAVYEMCRRALMNARVSGWQQELRDQVAGFFAVMGLEFGGVHPVERRELSTIEMQRIIRLAFVAAKCRSGLVRDGYSKEVIGVKSEEAATRLATVLGQLYSGMEVIGVREEERWRLVRKVGLDSMPKLRRRILDLAFKSENSKGASYEELVADTGVSRSVVERTVTEMVVYGVLERERDGKKNWVRVVEGVRKELEG